MPDSSGCLRFGVIPAAMPVTPTHHQSVPACATPLVNGGRLLSHSSIEIQRGLEEGTLEAGLDVFRVPSRCATCACCH